MKLATYLDENGIKPAQFASELGVPASTISRILSGKRRPSIDTLEKIAKATSGKVRIDDFYVGAVPDAEPEGVAA